MPTYKVRSSLTHGYIDEDGENQTVDKTPGDEVELSKEEAQPLLEAGSITPGDNTELADKEEKLGALQTEAEELQAKVVSLQQEIKDLQQDASRDPNLEHGTLVANPAAAPPRPVEGEDYNSLSRTELQGKAREAGISSSGSKGDLVNRLNAYQLSQGASAASRDQLPEEDEASEEVEE